MIGVYPIAHCDNNVEIVIIYRFIGVPNVHFLHIAFFIQFAAFEYALEMFGYDTAFFTEKLGKGFLSKPNGFFLNKDFDLNLANSIGVEEEVGMS